jgi:hypothetical protein
MVHKERKFFVLEKEKQKTFTRWLTRPISQQFAYANEQKFFGSFFQKITLSYSVCAGGNPDGVVPVAGAITQGLRPRSA